MILDELVLHDFGVYRGRHVFNLAPDGPARPIILVGAQNGAGKTTFLEGLQLALYGRLAPTGFRGASSYDAYLRGSIHRLAPPAEGAQVQVRFRRTIAGVERRYDLLRCWSIQKAGLRETFEVVVDGAFDRVLTEQWSEFIEEMLPPRIAPLFFFDGEKIEQFADLKRSSEIIGVSIKALLGLDIVERLELDLEVLERRKMGEQSKLASRESLAEAESAVEAVTRQRQSVFDHLASVRTRRDRALETLDRAKKTLQGQGGDLFAAREQLAAERSKLESDSEGARRDARAWTAGSAPLLLVQDLIADVHRQASLEGDSEATRTILSHLHPRDTALLDKVRGLSNDPALLEALESFLRSDRQNLEERASGDSWLGLSPAARSAIQGLVECELSQSAADRDGLLIQLDGLEAERDDIERRIAAIPAPESVEPLVQAVTANEAALLELEAEIMVAQRDLEVQDRELALARSRYQLRFEQEVRASLAQEDVTRLVHHSAKARDTLAKFKREVVRFHVHRLERLILEALGEVLRKSDLIANVTIDPETFAMELRDAGWGVLPPENLSAGERQLFAVALLWALAKASGQVAPTVIDTPLGRLDSQHRRRLVDRYFPRAAEQVILLSTDEEIDAPLYAELEPSMSRSYTITYDPEAGGSAVRAGYAFAATAREAA
jgi:DNA sulfur modification protein DndD